MEVNNNCPYCGSDMVDYNAGNGGDEANDILYYTCVCEKCGTRIAYAYRAIGFVTLDELKKLCNTKEI